MEDFTGHIIGVVRNGYAEEPVGGWSDVVSEIHLEELLTPALDGIEEYSHLHVLFWLHRRGALPAGWKLHPRDRLDLPLVGVFATRTQLRPNPIALTTVRLLSRGGAVLRVQGLDALDGSPVVDIKPYVPPVDQQEQYRTPPWVARL